MKDQLGNFCRDSFLKDALNAFIRHYHLPKSTSVRLVAAFITSRVRCKSSSEVGGLRVAKKVDVSDDQKWAACVLLKGRCK